jgi:DNA-binding LytR/AlgR family response regulator
MQWGSIMSARAIQDQKAIAPGTFVQGVPQGNADVPVGVHRGNMIATVEIRPDYILDNAEEKEQVHASRNGVGEVSRIAIKAKRRVLFVDPVDVVVAKAQGNYVALVHKSGSYLVRETMATAEQKLTPLGFVRIHRSILVNTTLVKDLRRDNTGTYVLRTTDGSEHPVGRAYKDNLKVIARSWLGVELEGRFCPFRHAEE